MIKIATSAVKWMQSQYQDMFLTKNEMDQQYDVTLFTQSTNDRAIYPYRTAVKQRI